MIRRAGRGAIIKHDLKDAFRHIPIALAHRWLMGFEWHGQYYVETCLSFGLRTAPFLFNMFAEGLHWLLLLLLPYLHLRHYPDDFIAVAPLADADLVPQFCNTWDQLTDFLGFTRNPSKDGQQRSTQGKQGKWRAQPCLAQKKKSLVCLVTLCHLFVCPFVYLFPN